jgi:hypothetical protein
MRRALLMVLLCGCAPSDDGGEGEGEGEPDVEDVPFTCQTRCSADAECFGGQRCLDGRCQNQPVQTLCISDAECLGFANPFFWSTPCNVQEDCGENEACVDIDGPTAVCAPLLDGSELCDSGPAINDVDGVSVEVCGSFSACADGVCVACRNDDECAIGFAGIEPRHCRDDGACVTCLEDAHCPAEAPVCYRETYCGCDDDDDCVNSGGGRCDFFGQCFGCSADADCEFSSSTVCLAEAICGCNDDNDCSDPSFVCAPLQ